MTAIKIKDLGKKVMDDYNAAMANPSTEYERGFVDGAQHQMKSSVDKAVNRMAKTEHEPWLLESTQTLAKTLAREFYPEVTQWKCLSDLAGVISQIDNMTTGLMRKPKQEPLTDEQSFQAELFKLAVKKGLLSIHTELVAAPQTDPTTKVSWMEGHRKVCDISNEAAYGIGDKT